MDTDVSKETWRRQFAAYRAGLSEKERAWRSGEIVKRLWELPEIQQAQTVHCYWPLVRRGEIDTRSFVEDLHAEGRTVALPVVTSFERRAPAMTARRYEGRACLGENRWGLAEPAGTSSVPPEALDAVIVPAFGAGRNGHRIGHGRGFYDAFLADVEAPTVCLVYDACLAAHVPAETHDVPVDVIVTETETVRPLSGAGV
jgi:5-formyltetrahydrofolate cyclo-ligase